MTKITVTVFHLYGEEGGSYEHCETFGSLHEAQQRAVEFNTRHNGEALELRWVPRRDGSLTLMGTYEDERGRFEEGNEYYVEAQQLVVEVDL